MSAHALPNGDRVRLDPRATDPDDPDAREDAHRAAVDAYLTLRSPDPAVVLTKPELSRLLGVIEELAARVGDDENRHPGWLRAETAQQTARLRNLIGDWQL